jgi:hypothetical protein
MLSNRKRGDRDEKRFVKAHGGKRVAGSGSSAEKKGDVEMGEFLVQNKCTTQKSFGIKVADLQKIEVEALNRGKKPALVMTQYVNNSPVCEWMAFPVWALDQLVGLYTMLKPDGK